ncbi:hypothetical protein [Porphyrobacter sp. YT40]|uniref:hypothetical protein n=1 Tax=Porphyrobacter sp. YT40 TaxID=2547601 RepID=UPI001143D706|nr:hypothetical protein [Porphyrobacter sp. YT40]QDH35048.1 hypothetical protein E2E27_12375 [Porphyrobacter sp. YT40]
MNFPRRFTLAPAGALLLAPLGAAAQPSDTVQPAETEAPQTEAPKPDAEAEEDKRICRYVKLDTSSRRKTKICRTVEEWRELNNPR